MVHLNIDEDDKKIIHEITKKAKTSRTEEEIKAYEFCVKLIVRKYADKLQH